MLRGVVEFGVKRRFSPSSTPPALDRPMNNLKDFRLGKNAFAIN
jgi:hypothetical protein